MNYSLACTIGLRGLKSRGYLNPAAVLAVLSIAFGVMILITVLSVMNGFSKEITKTMVAELAHITINPLKHSSRLQQEINAVLAPVAAIVGVAPFIMKQSLLSAKGAIVPAIILGVDPDKQGAIDGAYANALPSPLLAGTFMAWIPRSLSQALNLNQGDTFLLVTRLSPSLKKPKYQVFTVGNIFDMDQKFNNSPVYVNYLDLQTSYGLVPSDYNIRLKVQEPLEAPVLRQALQQALQGKASVFSWNQQYSGLFKALMTEKNMMFLVLSLIMVMAILNLVSLLILIVNEKKTDIAILQTLGLDSYSIRGIFIFQGLLLSSLGIVLGVMGGLLLTYYANWLVTLLQNLFHVTLINADISPYLPTDIQLSDIGIIVGFTLILACLATLYPAQKAASFDPMDTLRHV